MSEQTKLIIQGRSDDQITIGGDISKVFYSNNMFYSNGVGSSGHDTENLVFSDGTIIEVGYTKSGLWKLNVIANGDSHVEKSHVADSEDYSDRIVMVGDFDWILQNPGEPDNLKFLENEET